MPNTPSPEPEAARVELLPCPFCGGSASFEEVGGTDPSWSVGCDDAGGGVFCLGFQSMTTFPRKSEAAKAWNRRAALSPPAQADAAGTMEEVERLIWAHDVATIAECDGSSRLDGDSLELEKLREATQSTVDTLLSAVRTIFTENSRLRAKNAELRAGLEVLARQSTPSRPFQADPQRGIWSEEDLDLDGVDL